MTVEKKFFFFIDCDEATDQNGRVRHQLYEAARLYTGRGGKVFALTTYGHDFISDTHAFTHVYYNRTLDRKLEAIRLELNREGNGNAIKLFVFAGPELLGLVTQIPNRRGDVIADISDEPSDNEGRNEDPDDSYSIVEYLLYYLFVVRFLRHMQQDANIA